MSKKIRILKAFVFSRPQSPDQRIPLEKSYPVGDIEIDDEMAEHPWIKVHLADGKIESDEQAAARLALEKERAKAKAEEDEKQRIASEAALARTVKQIAANNQTSAEVVEKELNTPVSKLRQRA